MIDILCTFLYLLGIASLVDEPLFFTMLIAVLFINLAWRFHQKILSVSFATICIFIFGVWLKDIGFIILSLGMLSNWTVIYLNDNNMPVDERLYGKINSFDLHKLPAGYFFSNELTKLRFLSDCLWFPGSKSVFSPGDVFLWLGYGLVALSH